MDVTFDNVLPGTDISYNIYPFYFSDRDDINIGVTPTFSDLIRSAELNVELENNCKIKISLLNNNITDTQFINDLSIKYNFTDDKGNCFNSVKDSFFDIDGNNDDDDDDVGATALPVFGCAA